MAIVLANVHVDLVDEPADKLVTVVMVIVVEFAFSGAYSSNKPFVIDDAAIPLRIHNWLEKFLDFVYQVVLFLIKWFPSHDLLSKWFAIEQYLDCWVYVADVGILHYLNKSD